MQNQDDERARQGITLIAGVLMAWLLGLMGLWGAWSILTAGWA